MKRGKQMNYILAVAISTAVGSSSSDVPFKQVSSREGEKE